MKPFTGRTDYIKEAGKRLGVSEMVIRACVHNPELHRLGGLIGQLDQYLKDPHTGRSRVLPPNVVPFIKDALVRCELEHDKLHLAASACEAVLADAWKKFGIERPRKAFEILSDYDDTTPASVVPPDDITDSDAADLLEAHSECL